MESTHPREGTETSAAVASSSNFRIESTHPREGTETWSHRCGYSPPLNQLTPARGRKLELQCFESSPNRRINSPPRGDGNAQQTPIIKPCSGINSPPRGDGNFSIYVSSLMYFQNQLTPARGRKLRYLLFKGIDCGINSPPRGDGNEFPRATMFRYLSESTHPREGTETCHSRFSGWSARGINSPPQGDGNSAHTSFASFVPRINSPPRGDGNIFFVN